MKNNNFGIGDRVKFVGCAFRGNLNQEGTVLARHGLDRLTVVFDGSGVNEYIPALMFERSDKKELSGNVFKIS